MWNKLDVKFFIINNKFLVFFRFNKVKNFLKEIRIIEFSLNKIFGMLNRKRKGVWKKE